MRVPNKLPELGCSLKCNNDTLYCIQQIYEFSDYISTRIVSTWDNLMDSEIDKSINDLIKNEEVFCKNNSVLPHTMTIRKVRLRISSEVIESKSFHHQGNKDHRHLTCESCKGNINYGDPVLLKDGKTFCCNDCLKDFYEVNGVLPNDDNYESLFEKEI